MHINNNTYPNSTTVQSKKKYKQNILKGKLLCNALIRFTYSDTIHTSRKKAKTKDRIVVSLLKMHFLKENIR